MARQMHFHFLYNALSSIREVVLQDPEYASDLIYDFTVYLRACIRTMQNQELISVYQEMDYVRAYVNIEKMRMGKRLHVTYDLQSEDFKVAPLCIQPLVENAIRHGIFPKGLQGGTVSIKTETLTGCHIITVKDDGVGFDYQKVQDEVRCGGRDSVGLDNTIFRMKQQCNADIVITSEIGTGTTVTVLVPK
ncbi:MAG: histidine kinase [Lachnospiraceae bacterium]|nr:histidine kinase [Lachnospiraceae bacterium]